MGNYSPFLEGIAARKERAGALLARWAGVSSGSRNPAGLGAMFGLLAEEMGPLGGELRAVDLPPPAQGRALSVRKRPGAAVQVLLAGHMDTVSAKEGLCGEAVERDGNALRGLGVADDKGGLLVLIEALRALEQSPWAEAVGWEVLVTPDEEIGSPGSAPFLREAAARHHLGLVFEPGLPGGALVGARKGSGNFTAEVRGRAAHAGRDPHLGRNAIVALARFIVRLNGLGGEGKGIPVNVGQVEGGGPVNIVPDRAACRFNLRVLSREDQRFAEERLAELMAEASRAEGILLGLSGGFGRPPRILDPGSVRIYEDLARCGSDLGARLAWETSGGASDANLLAAAGLPLADGLGAPGGGLHTSQEYVLLDGLAERAELAALFLMKLGAGEIDAGAFRAGT